MNKFLVAALLVFALAAAAAFDIASGAQTAAVVANLTPQ
jgi:hypothetical protein